MAAAADPGSAADTSKNEQHDGERQDREPEQAVARLAAPDQVRTDDEPDEQVERAAPGRPRKTVRARGLRSEQRRLDEPTDPDTPGRQVARGLGMARVVQVRDGSLSVGEQRRPEEQLSQLRPPSVLLASCAPVPRARSTLARGAGASTQ